MRILLVTGDHVVERELGHLLERQGHEITQQLAGGDELLASLEQGARFHAAVLNQAILGGGWPLQVRHLRRRAPYLPAVILLAPGTEDAWRQAVLAGAFEAVPLEGPLETILEALSRALNYSAGRPLLGLSRSPYVLEAELPPSPAAPPVVAVGG